jgi:GNAT superfamily N-acetyltransferase
MNLVEVLEITDQQGNIVEQSWLVYAEPVHRQLRPQLSNYKNKMKNVFSGGGRMCVAVYDEQVLGLAVYRVYENTFSGCRFYVDDLVVDEKLRSRGIGHQLLDYLENKARQMGCNTMDLEVSMHRTRAHKFYVREGLIIPSLSLRKTLS